MLPHAFVALLMPVASTALVKSSLRAHDAIADSTGTEEQNQWWPFNIFGGRGQANGAFKQTLENLGDAQYFGPIEVGGQRLKAVIDTGSFELLVFGVNCTTCGNKDLYDVGKSKSSQPMDAQTTHTFGSGTTYSQQVMDSLRVGRFSVPNQSFWEVYDAEMGILRDGDFQAIFGIGPPASAIQFAMEEDKAVHEQVKALKEQGQGSTKRVREIKNHYDDMVDLMKSVTSVSENFKITNMSICLGQKSESPGYFIWDDVATQRSPEKFATVEVNGDHYWSTTLEQVHLAGVPIHGENVSKKLLKLANGTINLGCGNANCSAILDTGTSLLVAPTAVVDAVYALAADWEAAGGSCEDLSQLPELRFRLDGIDLSLPPEAYMGSLSGEMYDDLAKLMPQFLHKHRDRRTLTGEDENSERGTCTPLMMSLDADAHGGQLWILGMPFFRKYYTSFQFIQRDGHIPKAATMSFSEQDGECRPGSVPQHWKNGTDSASMKNKTNKSPKSMPILQSKTDQRRAQLKIDASRILIPNLVRDATRKTRTRNLIRHFLHM